MAMSWVRLVILRKGHDLFYGLSTHRALLHTTQGVVLFDRRGGGSKNVDFA